MCGSNVPSSLPVVSVEREEVAEHTSAHKATQKTTAGPRGRTSCQLHRRPPNNNIIIKLSLAFKGGSVRGCPGFPVAALRELLDASDGVNTAVKRLNGGFEAREAAATTPRNNNYIRFMSCVKRQRQRQLISTSATAAFKKSSLIASQSIAVLMMQGCSSRLLQSASKLP